MRTTQVYCPFVNENIKHVSDNYETSRLPGKTFVFATVKVAVLNKSTVTTRIVAFVELSHRGGVSRKPHYARQLFKWRRQKFITVITRSESANPIQGSSTLKVIEILTGKQEREQ